MENRLIHIYTGDGKGKTTSAVGLIIRAIAHNLKPCYISFHKGNIHKGEKDILEKLGVPVFAFARKCKRRYPDLKYEEIRNEVLEGMKFIKKIFEENKYDLIVLDEILISLREGYISVDEILDLINSKPKNLELILTGRCNEKIQEIIPFADYVTEFKKIKHPYDRGIGEREGIEY